MARITNILVPTDFSETSDAALAYAKTLAETLGASLHLIHVFEDPYIVGTFTPEVYGPVPVEWRDAALTAAQRGLDERLSPADQQRFRGSVDIVTGSTAKTVVAYAAEHDIDLIVMGTHGRGGVAHLLLGSVAERVVRTAHCPVLTVRNPGEPRSSGRESRAAATVV